MKRVTQIVQSEITSQTRKGWSPMVNSKCKSVMIAYEFAYVIILYMNQEKVEIESTLKNNYIWIIRLKIHLLQFLSSFRF